MLLPHLVNLLLARTQPDGAPFLRMGMSQLTVASFSANTITALEGTPDTGVFGLLMFRVTFPDFDVSMFDLELFHAGARLHTGNIASDDTIEGIDVWALIRPQYPIRFVLTNNDVNNIQVFQANIWYIIVDTSDQWAEMQAFVRQTTGVGAAGVDHSPRLQPRDVSRMMP